jgi:hypothetical protein
MPLVLDVDFRARIRTALIRTIRTIRTRLRERCWYGFGRGVRGTSKHPEGRYCNGQATGNTPDEYSPTGSGCGMALGLRLTFGAAHFLLLVAVWDRT